MVLFIFKGKALCNLGDYPRVSSKLSKLKMLKNKKTNENIGAKVYIREGNSPENKLRSSIINLVCKNS